MSSQALESAIGYHYCEHYLCRKTTQMIVSTYKGRCLKHLAVIDSIAITFFSPLLVQTEKRIPYTLFIWGVWREFGKLKLFSSSLTFYLLILPHLFFNFTILIDSGRCYWRNAGQKSPLSVLNDLIKWFPHTDHFISARRPDLIIINKKKENFKIVDFARAQNKIERM